MATQFLLFGARKDRQGGAHDFLGAYKTRDEAHEAAFKLEFVHEPRTSSWVHLAEFDGQRMCATYWLNIPNTEWDEHGELLWVAYE